jgi:hypothetical protein
MKAILNGNSNQPRHRCQTVLSYAIYIEDRIRRANYDHPNVLRQMNTPQRPLKHFTADATAGRS